MSGLQQWSSKKQSAADEIIMGETSLPNWERAKDCLEGHPAFVLGNGPSLPDDLSGLDQFFTVGVNRIQLRFEPTVLIWTDANVMYDLQFKELLEGCKALVVVPQEINYGGWYGLEMAGASNKPSHAVPEHPGWLPWTGNTGVSAAYWAIALGCAPIYLVGMSAEYEGELTNFYGRNPHHERCTLVHLERALGLLLGHCKNVRVISDGEELKRTIELETKGARGREFYSGRIRNRLSGVHTR